MRTVKEWIAKHDDQAMPRPAKRRIVLRQDGYCFGPCHRKFDEKLKPEFHHVPSLESGKGQHRETMIEAWCPDCHGVETAMQATARARTNSIIDKRYGIKTKKQGHFARLREWRDKILAERAHRNTD